MALPSAIRSGWIVLGVAAAMACDGGSTEPGAIDLKVLPTSIEIAQGSFSSITATLTRSGAIGAVSLTVSGVPEGVTTVISNDQTTGAVTTAVVRIDVGVSVPPGSYLMVVRGTASGVNEVNTSFVLNVTFAPVPQCLSPDVVCEQWASFATASSQYNEIDWGAIQATGPANVGRCADDERAWASYAFDGVDWLELRYAESVRPTEIRVYEVNGVSSIVKVEVKDGAGNYHTVFTTQPAIASCPRILSIPVTGVSTPVNVVRLSFDQRSLREWNEIDAVKLIGQQ